MYARFKRIASSTLALIGAGVLSLGLGAADAQAQWFEHSYGGEKCREAGRGGVQPVRDGGGYIAAGESFSPNECESSDIYVVRTHNDGRLAWSRTYNIGGNDSATDIQEVFFDPEGAGGFIVTGVTENENSEFCRASRDIFLMRLDRCGNVMWVTTYGTERTDDIGWDVVEARIGDDKYGTRRGDFIVAGSVIFPPHCQDAYLMRTDHRGNLIWDALYNGPNRGDDYFYALDECFFDPAGAETGDIVAAGGTNSYFTGSYDAWIVRVNGHNGEFTAPVHGAAAYGREGFEELRSIQELKINEEFRGHLVATGRTGDIRFPEVYVLQTRQHPCEMVNNVTMGDGAKRPDEGYYIREIPFDINEEIRRGDLVVTGYVSTLVQLGGHGRRDAFLQTYRAGSLTPGNPFTMVYGGEGNDWGWSVSPVSRNECRSAGFIMTGLTNSPGLVDPFDPMQLYLVKTDEFREDFCTARRYPVKDQRPEFEPQCERPSIERLGRQCTTRAERTCQFWHKQICLEMKDIPFCPVDPCECGHEGKETLLSETPAGDTEVSSEGFAVSSYPNPVKRGTTFSVEYNLAERAEVTIVISDVSGKVVYTANASSGAGQNTASVSTEQWPAGAYMVSVKANNRSETKRIIVAD